MCTLTRRTWGLCLSLQEQLCKETHTLQVYTEWFYVQPVIVSYVCKCNMREKGHNYFWLERKKYNLLIYLRNTCLESQKVIWDNISHAREYGTSLLIMSREIFKRNKNWYSCIHLYLLSKCWILHVAVCTRELCITNLWETL